MWGLLIHPVPESLTILISNYLKGSFSGLIGENGCGKTTLLYLIAKVLTPSKGEILFKDQPYADIALSDFYQKIGFIFQNPENQIFGSTVAEEILYAPKNFGLISKDQSKTVSNADLEKFISLINEKRLSLAELSQRNPFLLSWGQKRRLNLASIFSYNPELLLIDEPFIGQDAESVQRIFEILHDYHQQGKTILLISHDLDLVKDHCSRIVNLQDLKEESSKNIETDETSLPIAKSSKTEKKTKLDQFLEHAFQNETPQNWYGQMNPVLKFVSIILFTIIIFMQTSILLFACLFICLFLFAWALGLNTRNFYRQIRWLFVLTAIYVPLNVLFDATQHPGEIILFFLWPPYFPIRRLTLYYSLRTGFLIMLLYSSAVIFTQTTSLRNLVYSSIQAGLPYRYAFAFMIGLRYIPLIQNEAGVINIAQKLRGFGLSKHMSISYVFKNLIYKISTLLIALFRKAHTTAMAIEIRGFGAYPKRTNLHIVPWRIQDTILLIIFVGITIFGVAYGLGLFPTLLLPSMYKIFLPLIKYL